jgi:hypothetical protein
MLFKAKSGLESTIASEHGRLEDEGETPAEENFVIQIDFVHPLDKDVA